MKAKDRIYLNTWLELKPYERQSVEDSYYLKISNEVKQAIVINKKSFALQMILKREEIDILACFLTSYLEDIISQTNIWNSFVRTHRQLYKKQLPFYNLDEYFEGEINTQDVSFLIWYFLNTVQAEKFIAPFNDYIVETAKKVMDIFNNAWDDAPENEYLKTFYQIDANENDFYVARKLIDTILFTSYLFYPDTLLDLREKEQEIIQKNKSDENLLMFLNDNRDNTIHKTHTRLMSLKGKEWAAEILGSDHPLCEDFLNMSQKISGLFLYKGQDDQDIFIEHIASGKEFKLTKKSFDFADSLKETDTILFIGIVLWKDEWWFSGVFFDAPFNSNIILDEKNSIESRMMVNFLDHQKQDADELLNKQLKAFKDINNGSQIAFMSSDKIEEFIRNYTEYFNETLNLSAEEGEEAEQRARKEGFFGTKQELKNFSEVSESCLVFFNPKSGVEIALEVNGAFPLPNNLYFKTERSEDDIMFLLMSEEISMELAKYCIDNCKTKLPYFNSGVGKLYLNDIDFLFRFWKKDNYHSKPSITFTSLSLPDKK